MAAITMTFSDTDYFDVTVVGTDDIDIATEIGPEAISKAGFYRTSVTRQVIVDGYPCTVTCRQGELEQEV